MEFTEVVSPSVAVPVICVLVCAFLVFAFGFKSPAQPPSFDVFDDDGKKRRAKKSKGSKSQSNGHAVVGGVADVNNSAKPQSSPRQTTKQQSSKSQASASKTKSAPQPVQEAPKKVKKTAAKEEVPKPAKKQEREEDFDADVDGWHTVPKKDKKQKKREVEKQDSPVKEEEIVAKSDETVEARPEETREIPDSPQEQRSKRKKEKKNKKVKTDEEAVEQSNMETEVGAAAASSVTVEPEPELIDTNKPEPEVVDTNKPEPEVVDPSIELQIQDAMDTTVSPDNDGADKKKKGKKDKKKATPVEEDDFVIPQAAMEPEVVEQELGTITDLPLKENTDALTVKVPKKKQKKERNKRNDEKLADSVDIGASGGVDSSLSQCSVSDIQPKKTKVKDTSVEEVPPSIETSPGAEGGASSDVSSPPQATATFDELGGTTESWTEAKPKSKKKKARRAD